MDSYVARQAIFDADLNVWAYELLFRSEFADQSDPAEGDSRTPDQIGDTFLDPVFEKLLHGTKASVNFSRTQLLSETGRTSLPPGTIIELRETAEPDDEVLAACAALKRQGYLIALGDYAGEKKLDRLLELADLLMNDVLAGPRRQPKIDHRGGPGARDCDRRGEGREPGCLDRGARAGL